MLTCKAIVLLLCPGVPWAQNDPSILAAYESAQQWRAHYGLQRQALDERACIMAQRHAEQMARFEWFEHGAHDQIIQRGARTADNAVRSWVYRQAEDDADSDTRCRVPVRITGQEFSDEQSARPLCGSRAGGFAGEW